MLTLKRSRAEPQEKREREEQLIGPTPPVQTVLASDLAVVVQPPRWSDVHSTPLSARPDQTRLGKMGKFKKLPTTRHPLFLSSSLKQDLGSIKKKTFKICLNKLRSIQDAETKLCQAVLINNTLKCLNINNDRSSEESSENKITNDFDFINERETQREDLDIFTEISLPPPLNTNQLEKFAIINSDKESFYYHEIRNYHREEEINLYNSVYNCNNLLNSPNLYNNLQRTQ